MSAKMKISPVSWIASIETDLRAGGASPPGTFLWCYTSSQRLPLNPLKHLTFKTVFCWPWVQVNAGVRSMLGYIRTSDTSQTGPRCLCTPHPASCPRTSWLRRVQIVWHQWSFQPWHHLWIGHSRVTGPYVQLEPCATTWTGLQTSGRIRS